MERSHCQHWRHYHIQAQESVQSLHFQNQRCLQLLQFHSSISSLKPQFQFHYLHLAPIKNRQLLLRLLQHHQHPMSTRPKTNHQNHHHHHHNTAIITTNNPTFSTTRNSAACDTRWRSIILTSISMAISAAREARSRSS